MGRKIVVTLTAACLVIGLGLPPARAGDAPPQQASDPAGDGVGAGDVRLVRINQDGGTGPLVFDVRLGQPSNLGTGPTWRPGSKSQLRVNLDHIGSTGPDLAVVVSAGQGGARARLFDVGQGPLPSGCLTLAQPAANLVRIRIPLSCIPEVGGGSIFARFAYDQGGNGTVESNDRAPDSGGTNFIDLPG